MVSTTPERWGVAFVSENHPRVGLRTCTSGEGKTKFQEIPRQVLVGIMCQPEIVSTNRNGKSIYPPSLVNRYTSSYHEPQPQVGEKSDGKKRIHFS